MSEENTEQGQITDQVSIMRKNLSGVNSVQREKNKRQEIIAKLKLIMERVASGQASFADIEKAKELSLALGGEFSSLIAAAESEVRAEAVKTAIIYPNLIDPVAAVDEYLNREDIKRSEAMLRDLESGKPVDPERLVETVENLTSKKDREEREQKLAQLEKEKKRIFKSAIIKGKKELSQADRDKIEEIDRKQLDILKREVHDQRITSRIGEHSSQHSRRQATLAQQEQIAADAIHAPGIFAQMDDKIKNSTHNLHQHLAKSHAQGAQDLAAKEGNVNAVDGHFHQLKEEIKQVNLHVGMKQRNLEAVDKKNDVSDLSEKDQEKADQLAARAAMKAAKTPIQETKRIDHPLSSNGANKPRDPKAMGFRSY
jgi:hypothetical protein